MERVCGAEGGSREASAEATLTPGEGCRGLGPDGGSRGVRF